MSGLAALASAACATGALLLAWPGAPRPVLAPRGGAPLLGAGRPHAPPDRALPLLAGGAAGLAVLLLVGGPVGLVAAAVAASAAAVVVGRMEPPSARRRREALEDGLPLAVDLLASCLAAGQAPGAAVEEVAGAVDGPLHEELRAVASRLRLGSDPVTVWQEVAAHPQMGPWGHCVLRAVDSGASVADAMAGLADDLRGAARARVEARARAVGVHAALPLGVCLLPAFVLLGVVPLVAGSLSVMALP